ncbi:pyruvate kinase [Saccharobesus litoralis]|uniref:Pyruvate kinase n=1 Tax=Saccharobesus litoralis TaxID=2172099 RepID=A0A2S0VUD2_9ALTE|nr:pyruvate kinase [Saccharobesus litoralis]AWB67827.1 pyruvate kinase [Saccharobesus litoralis]
MTKQTKIVATVSDLKGDVEFITELYKRGVNVIRLNTAHQTPEDTRVVIENVRKVSDKLAVLVDTKGPEMRTNLKIEEDLNISTGDKVTFRADGLDVATTREAVQVNYLGFVKDVPVGAHILIDDGLLELVVDSKDDEALYTTALNNGKIKKKKSVNVPGVEIKLPSVTERDKSFIEMAIDAGVDFIAHSFVRNKQDVLDVQEILDAKNSPIKIISKIENREGVDNLDEILEVTYGVMVARGDLGIEIPGEEVPLVQKAMIQKCIKAQRPVITATQMLESMIQNPRPTRAEISDVANAVLDGTDAVMLSGESAYGDYPFEAVETMARICSHVEDQTAHGINLDSKNDKYHLQEYICKQVAKSARDLDVDAIVVPTATGSTARQIASHRPAAPLYAACYTPESLRLLSLSYGVDAYLVDVLDRKDVIKNSISPLVDNGTLQDDSLVVIAKSAPGSPKGETNRMEINTVESFLNRD